MRYIWCDYPNHKYSDYRFYKDAKKNDIITFKKGKIRNDSMDESLKIIFERDGMKKLMDDR